MQGSRRRTESLIAGVTIGLLIVAAALMMRPGSKPSSNAPAQALTAKDRALLDSLRTADARRDWVAALRWAEQLGRKFPRAHAILLARGTAWSNFAIAQRPGRTLLRPALRTSLARVDCLRRALVLTDSAAIVAADESQWVEATEHLAQLEETIGLPGDALIAYETIKQQSPSAAEGAAMRAYWLRALLYDPVNPDTSEWDRRMRHRGSR